MTIQENKVEAGVGSVALVPLSEAHLETVRKWRMLPHVTKYLYTDPIITEEGQIKWFAVTQTRENEHWYIISEGSIPIGIISLSDYRKLGNSVALGIYVAEPTSRGSKVGSKALFLLCDKGFTEFGYHKIVSDAFSWNESAIGMYESLGFRREGYFRSHVLKGEDWHDVVSLALLKKEWMISREAQTARLFSS